MASPGPDTLIRATFKRQMGRAPGAGAEDARQRRTSGRGREMRVLHGKLVAMQEWVKGSGARICVVFEGRDTAGKGGTIKRITERMSPRSRRAGRHQHSSSAGPDESRLGSPKHV